LSEYEKSLAVHKDEILLRRVEFLLANNAIERAEKQIVLMNDPSSVYSIAAIRLIFVTALSAWEADRSDLLAADRVISLGSSLIESLLPPPPQQLRSDISTIITAVAEAADHRAVLASDASSSDLAYRLSKLLLSRGTPNEGMLHRTARLAEQNDDPETGLEAWLLLLARYLTTEPSWYEARYESFRLMLLIDPDRAKVAFDQYRVLHPNPGPEPWGGLIQDLLSRTPAGGGG
jgi:hypothetical protein